MNGGLVAHYDNVSDALEVHTEKDVRQAIIHAYAKSRPFDQSELVEG